LSYEKDGLALLFQRRGLGLGRSISGRTAFGEQPAVKLLSGKIAALEPELSEHAPSLVVRGYDLAHKLYRGRQRRSFTQVTDSDLVNRLANESGLHPGNVESTSEVHEYVFQNNQTNADFLLERAPRIGS